MSKGDWKRPRDSGVSKKQYDSNFEGVFGKKEIKTWNPEEDNEQEKSVQNQPTCERRGGGETSNSTPCTKDPDGEAGTTGGTQPSESSN